MIPDEYELSKAGFYYTGQLDKVVCFRCGVMVKDWERHDSAMDKHQKCSSNCEYIKMVGVPKQSGFTLPGPAPNLFVRQFEKSQNSLNSGMDVVG